MLAHRTLRQSASPQLAIMDAGSPALPQEVARFFDAVIDETRPLGFEVRGRLHVPRMTGRVEAFALVLIDRAEKAAALASALHTRLPGEVKEVRFVEFATQYRDETSVQTHNADRLRPFPPKRGSAVAQLPSVREAATLYRVHRMLVARHARSSDKILLLDETFGGDVAAHTAHSLTEGVRRQAAAGRFVLTADGSQHRPTWSGAAWISWNRLWPVTAVRKAAIRRGERKLLADLKREGV